ncbi:MAG: VWA domain-containing protein [Myxococcaceae bacterium]
MTLGAPLGLLALLAMPALVAAYFLRRRQPPRTVSALFLWKTPDQRAEAGPRLNRFSREASLALELLAVLFAALFLADLRCGADAPRQHVVIVLDGSLSMNAVVDGKSAVERAKDEVASIARSENAGVLTLLESGVKPSVIAGPQQDRDRALSALEKWSPAQPAHDPSAAFTLARELSGGVEHRVFFLTDGPLPDSIALPPLFEARSVGKRAANVAFLSAQRRDENGFAQVTVRVGNFADQAARVTVRFSAPDDAPQRHTVDLSPGGSSVLRVGFKTKEALKVDLDDDALPEDGHLVLLPAPVADVNVALLDGLDGNAVQALKRFLNVAVGVRLASPALLTIGPPGTQANLQLGAKGTLKSFVGPFFAQKGNTLLDDVQLGGVVWTAGENPPGRVLMSAGEVVLISEEDDGTLHLNLELSRSNVQRTVAWPVLLSNVVRQVRLGAPGFPRKHLMLGEDTPLVASSGSKWELKGPRDERRTVIGSGVLTLPPLPASGRWVLEKDGEKFDELVVLPLDPRESDLRTRGAWEVVPKQERAFASLATTRPRPWWPLALVLLLVLVDFWLTAAPRRDDSKATLAQAGKGAST